MGMGDVEAAIVLEELARVDVSSAILCQLVFNGPPRAIEHLGNDALRRRWLPLAAAGELFCIGITEPDAGSAATAMRAQLIRRRRRLAARGVQELRDRRSQGRGLPGVVPLPGQRAGDGQGHRGRGGRPVGRRGERRRHPPQDGAAGLHRGRAGLRRRAHRARRRARARGPGGQQRAQDAARPHQPRALRQRRDVRRRRPGGARVRHRPTCTIGRPGRRRLADLQGLQWKIADAATELEGARLLLQRALRARRAPTAPRRRSSRRWPRSPATWPPSGCATRRSSSSAATATAASTPSSAAYRDIRGLCIGAGTVEIQRNFVGTALLGGKVPAGPWWKTRPS